MVEGGGDGDDVEGGGDNGGVTLFWLEEKALDDEALIKPSAVLASKKY